MNLLQFIRVFKFKIISILFAYFISMCCKGQETEIKFSNIFELAKNKIKFDVLDKQHYSDSATISGFNFFTFNPIKSEINFDDYYKIFLKDGSIRKIARFNSIDSLKNYDIFMFPTEKFTFYTIYMFTNSKHIREDGYFVNGFFFHMLYNQFNFFVGLNNGLLPVSEQLDEYGNNHKIDGNYLLHFLRESTVKDVDKIMVLDKNLKPESRLNYYQGELLSNSRLKYKGPEVYEVLELLPFKSCSLKTNLREATLNTIFDIINRVGCHSYFQALVKPDYPNGSMQPIWSYNDRYYIYDYENLDCFNKQ